MEKARDEMRRADIFLRFASIWPTGPRQNVPFKLAADLAGGAKPSMYLGKVLYLGYLSCMLQR